MQNVPAKSVVVSAFGFYYSFTLYYSAIFNSLIAGFFFNSIRASNSLDPDQARHFVGPDLGPNCLQRLSAND